MSWAPALADRDYHLFTGDYEDLRTSVRDFLASRLEARAEELEGRREFPRDVFKELGDLGYLALALPEEAGGADDLVADAVLCEELGRTGVLGFADAVLRHRAASLAVAAGGGPGDILADLAAGRRVAALALLEPSADPDPEQAACRARPDGDLHVLEGTKAFVPNAAAADVLVVSARVDERVHFFLTEVAELSLEPREMLALWESPAADVRLDGAGGVRLKAERLLERVLRWHDLGEAFALCGLAFRAIEDGRSYGLEREAFGRPVARFQVWRHRWADRSTEVEAARALCVHALRVLVHGEPAGRAVAGARLYAGRVALAAADECVQMHGGYGYMMEFAAQRYWRDARQATIVAGGDASRLERVARELGL